MDNKLTSNCIISFENENGSKDFGKIRKFIFFENNIYVFLDKYEKINWNYNDFFLILSTIILC